MPAILIQIEGQWQLANQMGRRERRHYRDPDLRAWPVQDGEEPYIELYVPDNWKKRQQFIAKLKPPPGFEHVSQYGDGELAETTSIFKYVQYGSYVAPDGRFDATGFIDSFREATKTLVAMEKVIDRLLGRLA